MALTLGHYLNLTLLTVTLTNIMKKLLYLFLTVLIVGCSGDAKKNDLTVLNLNGNVKSITETVFEAIEKFGEITNGKIKYTYSFIFNNNGNKIEENYYEADGSLKNKQIYKYDDNGNMFEENYYEADGSLGYKKIYKYDDKGNMFEGYSYEADGSLGSKFIYKYDDNRNKIEDHIYKADGSLGSKNIYKYDDNGFQVYKKYGFNSTIKTDKYDDRGNKIETIYYWGDDKKGSKNTYKYDNDNRGNWINQVTYFDDLPFLITEREIEYYKP